MIGRQKKTVSKKKLKHSVLFGCLFLVACTMPREEMQPNIPKTLTTPVLPDKVLVRDNAGDAILDLNLSDDMLVASPLEKSDALPDVYVDNFSAIDASATEAFRLLLLDKSVAVSTDESANDVKVNITNYSGKLQDVAERLSETAGVFYTYKKGLLRLSKDRSFIVPLPPVSEAFQEMTDVITGLGATEIKLDKSSRMVTFRATRKVFDSISSYLERLRNQKAMIVYETYFLEVTLENVKATGINWRPITKGLDTGELGNLVDNSNISFDQSLGKGSPAFNIVDATGQRTLGGLAFGALFTSGSLNINTLFEFLSRQGDVQTISRPTITVMSGGKAKFEVGRKKRYVSRTSVTTTEGVSGNSQSIETEDLSLGLKTEIAGDYSDDSVFTTISISLDELVQLTPVSVQDTQIQLPETTTRVLNTTVRVRPGDAILIAGINQARDGKQSAGPFMFGDWMPFLNSKEDTVIRSELVIVLKPRVVRFTRAEEKKISSASAPAATVAVPDLVGAPLVLPQGSNNILSGATADPNLSSQVIYMPNGSVSPQPVLAPQSLPPHSMNDDLRNMAPLQPPVAPAASAPKTGWYQNYPDSPQQPIMLAPSNDVSGWSMGAAGQPAPANAENYDAVTSGDTYSTSAKSRIGTQDAAPYAPPAAPDPMADSFGYYGSGSKR